MTADSPTASPSVRVTTHPEGPVAYSVRVEVDAGRVRKAFDRAYRDLGRRVQVKGFRPGKVPRSVLEKLYSASLAEQLEHTLVAETLAEAIEQAGLEPVAEPAIDAAPPRTGSDFHYTARVEVKPTVELPDTRGLPAVRPAVDVTDAEIDERVEALRQRHAPLVEQPPETPLATGLIATLDFVGRVGGAPFEGGSGQGVDVEIGSGQLLPGFEDQLIGARAGDDVEVRVTFPEGYGNADLAGKEAEFACHVVSVKERRPAALDDEFAKDMGDFESLAALRQRIRDDLTKLRERESRQVLRRSLLDALVERTSFEVPAALVERALERQLRAAEQRLHGQVPEEAIAGQLAQWREQWRDGAEREVREMLLLESVARQQGIDADDAEADARIAEMAAEQGVDASVLRRAYGDEGLVRAVKAQLVEDKALDFLASEAKVGEKTDS